MLHAGVPLARATRRPQQSQPSKARGLFAYTREKRAPRLKEAAKRLERRKLAHFSLSEEDRRPYVMQEKQATHERAAQQESQPPCRPALRDVYPGQVVGLVHQAAALREDAFAAVANDVIDSEHHQGMRNYVPQLKEGFSQDLVIEDEGAIPVGCKCLGRKPC